MSALRPPNSVAGRAKRSVPALLRTSLSNGIVVIGSENHVNPSVVLRLSVPAAPVLDTPARAGLAALTASALMRGTEQRSFADINETVDAAGMSFFSGAGRHLATISTKCLREDLSLAVDLMADVARHPVFPSGEVEQLRGQVLTGLRQADDDTASVADRNFRELAYPEGHPYRLRTHGYQETVAGLGRDDLAAFYEQAYGVEDAFVIVVGDVAFEDAVRLLEEALGGWRPAGAGLVAVPDPPSPAPAQREIALAGKTQSDLVVGRLCMRRSDPDYYALRMANLIFGRIGMMGRLGETVREQHGLAYSVYSELDASLGMGTWSVRAGVNPANVGDALAGIAEQVRRLREDGITADELERAQRYTTGTLTLQLETNDGVAGVIQDLHLYDLGLDFLERYPDIVNSLTLDQVNEVASRRIPQYEETVRVVAGPART